MTSAFDALTSATGPQTFAQAPQTSAFDAPCVRSLKTRLATAKAFNYAPLNSNRAVFFDRDGTLIVEKEYLCRPEQVVLFPGVGPALRRLHRAGFKLFIVSNQSGVGRAYFTLADVDRVNARMLDELARDGVVFEKIYIAPEAPNQPSHGRKPSPQFLFDARDEFGIELEQSFLVGDKLIDLQCGWNAGVRQSILVRTGYGREVESQCAGQITSALVVDGIPEAAAFICENS